MYNITHSTVYKNTEKFIRDNSTEWRKTTPNIDYENPFCRMAYLYMNVAIHSYLITTVFDIHASILKGAFSQNDVIKIGAFGGGPGSELLGTINFLEKNQKILGELSIDFLLIDTVREWDESWHSLKQGVDNYFRKKHGSNWRKWPILVNRSFLPLDATKVSDYSNFPTRFSDIDIYIFSYITSELKGETDNFSEVIDFLSAHSK